MLPRARPGRKVGRILSCNQAWTQALTSRPAVSFLGQGKPELPRKDTASMLQCSQSFGPRVVQSVVAGIGGCAWCKRALFSCLVEVTNEFCHAVFAVCQVRLLGSSEGLPG